MLSIKGSNFQNTADFIKEFNLLLEFYGFQDFYKLESSKAKLHNIPQLSFSWEKEALSLLKQVASSGVYGKTDKIQFYLHDDLKQLSKSKTVSYSLHSLNEQDAFAEAILLFLVNKIINKLLGKNIIVEVNSLGDQDTIDKYLIDLKRFLRKRKKLIPQSVLNEYEKGNYLKALSKLISMKHPAADDAPLISDYLTDIERKHLYSLLDYLENMGVNYTFNSNLFASVDIWKYTIFNLYIEDQESNLTQIGFGGRADNFAQAASKSKKEHVFVKLDIENLGRKKNIENASNTKDSSKFFFVQIGLLAKSKGVKLLDKMCEAGLDVEHTVCNLSLLEQYKLASSKGAKYLIILGHKEAIENNVIVRNMHDNTQEIIPEDDLIKYLKKLK